MKQWQLEYIFRALARDLVNQQQPTPQTSSEEDFKWIPKQLQKNLLEVAARRQKKKGFRYRKFGGALFGKGLKKALCKSPTLEEQGSLANWGNVYVIEKWPSGQGEQAITLKLRDVLLNKQTVAS